jgi:hypothetical protein
VKGKTNNTPFISKPQNETTKPMAKFTATKTTESRKAKTLFNPLVTDYQQIPAIDEDGDINGIITRVERVKDKNRETGKLANKFKFTIQVFDEDGLEMNLSLRTNCRITGKKFPYKDGSMKYSKLVRFLQALEIVPLEIDEKDSFQFDLSQLVNEAVSFKLYEENGFYTPYEDSFSFIDEDVEDSGEE